MTIDKMKNEKFSFKRRIKSFSYASKGIAMLFKEEHNARIHITVAILVIIASIFFKISVTEWIAVLLCIGGVFSAEAINSAIESLADAVSEEYHPLIKKCKDFAAAGVLLFVIFVVIVGLIIFVPKIINLFL